jgi:hypothetical protein
MEGFAMLLPKQLPAEKEAQLRKLIVVPLILMVYRYAMQVMNLRQLARARRLA